MPIFDQGKLQKLKIHAYTDETRKTLTKTFTAMFNPASYSQKYEVQYDKKQSTGSSGQQQNFIANKPITLSLKLILDGTRVNEIGLDQTLDQSNVTKRVNEFLDTAFKYDGVIHQSRFLSIEWGDLSFWGDYKFDCRLLDVNVSYTSFKPDGTALRAELDISLISDMPPKKRKLKDNNTSPDLTHSRIVKSGDTLPLLCKEIYGKSSYYLYVAEANALDNFRMLTPGQMLYFPPLVKK